MTLTAGSLFSGIGGLDLAASLAGFDIRFQVEIDPFCRKVLAKHAPDYWKNTTQFANICGLSGLETVDVLFGGFPCQDISHAGKVIGLEGARSGLWCEFCRLIGEIRPRAVVLENVAAITYAGRGGTEVIAALAGLGYSAQWGIVSAADAGAPHQRNRWFCVGYADSIRLSESPTANRGQVAYHVIGNTEAGYGRDVSCEPRPIRQILRAKTGLAYPYRQRRTETRGYRAEARERLIRTGAVGYTNSQYLKEQRFRFPMEAELQTFGCDGEGIAGPTGTIEPGVGGNADGVSAKLHSIGDGGNLDRDRMITDLVSAGALEIDFETGEIFSTRIRGMNGQRVRLNGANVRGYINHNISYKGKKRATRAHHIADDFQIGKSQVHNVVTGKSWADCDAKLDGTRLMQHQWVARPNEPQHEDEPPRLCGKIPNRRARIKALGNAVVPQVVYPIFKLLAEYLTETR